jgi:hypothetical protein
MKKLDFDKIPETVEESVNDIVKDVHFGRIVYLNYNKPFGFLMENRSGTSYFFHQRDCCEPVKLHDLVEFIIGEFKNRPVAQMVRKVNCITNKEQTHKPMGPSESLST